MVQPGRATQSQTVDSGQDEGMGGGCPLFRVHSCAGHKDMQCADFSKAVRQRV